MEEILSLLAHFQEELQALNNDFKEVKNKVYKVYKEKEELEEENRKLKKLLFNNGEVGSNYSEKSSQEVLKSYNNLSNLYEEGFHICHFNFGEKRDGNCLFCKGLLDNNFKEVSESG